MKIPQSVIDSVPGLAAAQKNSSIEFLNLDTDDTSPTLTHGFTDDQVKEMNRSALEAQLNQINSEEKSIVQMQLDLNRRRQQTFDLLKRKSELD